jgi:hypothetical protein
MSESIVEIRLTRNLRYKITYVRIFETYIESVSDADVTALLQDLIQAQQTATAPLSRYLRRLDVKIQDVELDEKLMNHALGRTDIKSRLRFIHDGLKRSSAWYRMQLVDKQMTADPELEQLLFELGEIDAAKLWRTETVMNMLKISVTLKEKKWAEQQPIPDPTRQEGWRPRLVEDVGRPSWSGDWSSRWSQQPKSKRKDR